jgi:lysophospholipase L1-like esterase
LGLRAFGSLNIHFYAGYRSPGVHRYPYGEIPINSHGYPDDEFNLNSALRRVGYFGDSVTYGVGAGYGYRVPDLLEARFPGAEHWVFASVGQTLWDLKPAGQVERFRLDGMIYVMNLNDIVPADGTPGSSTVISQARKGPLGRIDDRLRGTSHLYTYLRLGLKNFLQAAGYAESGLPAIELFPRRNAPALQSSVARIAEELQATARFRPVRACVVILPYEMQVSRDAARRYRDMGFKWEAGFEDGSAQEYLMAAFRARNIEAFDAIEAFEGRQLRVGEAFVYNKGDKADWNHPNRRGHEIIAEWLVSHRRFVSSCLEGRVNQP